MPELYELQATKKNLLQQAHDIHERAEKEHRSLSAEERTNFDRAFHDAQALKDDIELAQRQRELSRELAELDAPSRQNGAGPLGGDGAYAHRNIQELSREYRELWIPNTYHQRRNKFGILKLNGLGERSRLRLEALEDELDSHPYYRSWAKAMAFGPGALSQQEMRDLMMGSDLSGGFTVPPEQFQATLIKRIDDRVYLRRLATKVVVTKAQDLGVPTLEHNPADSDWTSELATGQDDTTMDFGKRAFAPHPLAKQIKVSKKLLRASALNIADLISDRFAYKFAITEEKAFLTGNGVGQPLGVFVASATGISTARDIKTANTTTALSADNLRAVKYALKAPYRATAQWIFHRDVVAQISMLKDTIGNYLWRDGLSVGDPDTLLGMPINESEYAPNTFTTGMYMGILGDFSNYWIADALDMTMQRLVELYAASNQEGFIMRQELDGMPVLEEAFVRSQLA